MPQQIQRIKKDDQRKRRTAMNREILFRGKRCDNGEWVYGYLLQAAGSNFIVTVTKGQSAIYEVEPDTIGQYIGLKDKNGNKIFDGDILRSDRYPFNSGGNDNYYAEVFWSEDNVGFYYEIRLSKDSNVSGISDGDIDIFEDSTSFEVIGNITDNSNLVKNR